MKRIAYIVVSSLTIASCGSGRTEVSTSKLAAVVTDNSPEALIAALPGSYSGKIDSPHDGGCTVKVAQGEILQTLVPTLNITVTNPSASLEENRIATYTVSKAGLARSFSHVGQFTHSTRLSLGGLLRSPEMKHLHIHYFAKEEDGPLEIKGVQITHIFEQEMFSPPNQTSTTCWNITKDL
ncbi:MAG: hypothetical protein NTV34_20735 [Proteobacteria bacterium]|nr:hypothetical protein [Pseudomonadota bacterium]